VSAGRVARAARGLRAAALAAKVREDAGPFLVGLHPTSDRYYGSVAVPDAGTTGDDVDAAALAAVRAVFAARGRTLRLELVPQDVPGVAEALVALGLEVEARVPLLSCTVEDLVHVAAPEGIKIEVIPAHADDDIVHEALTVGREAFEGAAPVTDDDVARVAQIVLDGGLIAARDAFHRAIGSGFAMAPQEGVSEVSGIGVDVRARNQGLGTALTSAITKAVFDAGVELAVLSPGDEGAHRIYTRCGYTPLAEMVFLRDPEVAPEG
jgi:GNAT superfamily N-acetyltransferase